MSSTEHDCAEGVTNEAAVGLPPLSLGRRETWDYYRIEFLEDGFPGRRSAAGLHPHPIYGTYVVTDYLGQYRRTGDKVYLQAAQRVADAAVSRMTEHHGALVFHYQPGTGLSSLPTVFYSGLTQARYLSALGKVDLASADRRYAEASAGILRSFEVAAEDGGVARRTPGGGLLIEEYSHDVPDYTLNGWTTATTLIHEYATAAADERALGIFEDSVRGICDVLPLYDVPELANSRYRLAGPAQLRLRFSHSGVQIRDGHVDIPGHGRYGLGAGGGKWTNKFLSGVRDGHVLSQQAIMQVLLCRVSWPRPNTVTLELHAPTAGDVTVDIGEDPFDPLSNSVRGDSYSAIARVPMTEGRNVIKVSMPWVRAELVAYPTSWTKRIGGRQYNSYHFIHIDTLQKLARATADDLLTYYWQKWERYPDRWPEMPVYSTADIELTSYRAPSRRG